MPLCARFTRYFLLPLVSLALLTPASAQVWAQRFPLTHPPNTSLGGIVFDSARNEVVLFGGRLDLGFSNTTWTWNGQNWTQKSPSSSPPVRFWNCMAYDSVRNKTVLY